MKRCWCSIFLAFVLFGLSFLISLAREQVFGQPYSGPGPAATQVLVRPPAEPPRWLVDFAPFEDPANPARKIRAITVVDPESKRILVYHEELATGKVKLLSTRNIQPDIQLDQFNAERPTPKEIEDEIRRLRKN